MFEAEARVRAARALIDGGERADGEAELQKPVAFYRSVGATFLIGRAEELLEASS